MGAIEMMIRLGVLLSFALNTLFFPFFLNPRKNSEWKLCPVKKSLLRRRNSQVRALSSSQISALSTALSSTSVSAGSNALQLLSDIASSQASVADAFVVICAGLTTQDSSHGNATPLSLATAAVKQTLSAGVILLPNDSYNYTLLHFAALFATFGNALNSSLRPITPAATIISTILSGLTATQIYAAVTAQDMWGLTPLHYAALSPNTDQSAVTSALLAGITDTSSKNAAISIKNSWGYTPVHYAAAYGTSSKAMINSLFSGLTATQKTTVFSIQDQWLATPLHYAALFKNTAIFNKTFLSGLSKSQKIALLNVKNFWNYAPTDYATFDSSKAALFDSILNTMTSLDLKTSLTVAVPSPKFEITTVVVPTFLIPQLSL